MKEVKIVLVGYMGSGKTTVGRIVANHLNINFLDLDASEIVKLYKNQVFYSDKEVPVKIQKPIQKFNFFLSSTISLNKLI